MVDSLKLELLNISASGCDGVIEFLKASRSKPVVICAKGVQRPAFQIIEALVVGKLQWQKDQVAFDIEGAEDVFQDNLSFLGLGEIFELECDS